MEWIFENWAIVTTAILLVDKIVAVSPTKHDDLIWTAIKGAFRAVKPK